MRWVCRSAYMLELATSRNSVIYMVAKRDNAAAVQAAMAWAACWPTNSRHSVAMHCVSVTPANFFEKWFSSL